MLLSTAKGYRKYPVRIFFGLLKNQVKYLINIKLEISTGTVCLHMIFLLFTLLYLIILLKINLMILLKDPSKEKALKTLHVTTETHFSIRNSLKISCLVLQNLCDAQFYTI